MKSLVGLIAAFLVGIVPAFFLNFNAVFSDSNGSSIELISVYLLIIICYLVLGLVFGFVAKKRPLAWGLTISLPTIIFLGLYSFREPDLIGLSLVSIILTVVSAWLGSYLGVRLRGKK